MLHKVNNRSRIAGLGHATCPNLILKVRGLFMYFISSTNNAINCIFMTVTRGKAAGLSPYMCRSFSLLPLSCSSGPS